MSRRVARDDHRRVEDRTRRARVHTDRLLFEPAGAFDESLRDEIRAVDVALLPDHHDVAAAVDDGLGTHREAGRGRVTRLEARRRGPTTRRETRRAPVHTPAVILAPTGRRRARALADQAHA